MKAVVFDFDGTLSYQTPNIWLEIWKAVGYKNDEEKTKFRQYFNLFNSGKISYQTWCDLTCNAFVEKGMNLEMLTNLTSKTRIIPGFSMFAHLMQQKGIEVHIVSGGIESVIKKSLGSNIRYVKNVSANKFEFDRNGKLKKIIATKYDYMGKATYVNQLIEKRKWSKNDVCFVGNSYNDEYVYKTGCKTICINPDGADYINKEKWNKVYNPCNNLLEIAPEVFEQKNQERVM